MKIYIDLKKAEDNTGAPKVNTSGALPAGSKKESKYGQKVWHRGKDRYPERPNNALGETNSTWVLPYGQKPIYNKTSNTNKEESQSNTPTSEEHKKLSEVASQMGNTKLAQKHSLLAESSSKTEGTKNKDKSPSEKKIPSNDQEKAQNLIHNSKATESKNRAKEVLRAAPSEHKEALKKIIEALEDHETKPHVPTSQEKRELRELVSAVNSVAKPIEKKRITVAKEFDKKTQEKQKENKKIYIKTEKDKERKQKEDLKNKQKEESKKEKEKQRADKEKSKIEAKKKKEYDSLKSKIDRDIKKPGSIEEEAQKATHVAEAKEVLAQIEAQLKESKDPDLTKLLEAHRSVAKRQLDVDRLPTKEDIKALRDTKKVIQQKTKQEQKENDSSGSQSSERTITQGQSSSSKAKNAYNTGRSTGESVSHQAATEESGGQLSGKAAGALGYGVASAGHKLLTDEDDNKVKVTKEFQKAIDSPIGIDSETGRNTDTFDDVQPVGQGSDLPEEEEDFGKSVLLKLEAVIPKVNKLEQEFLRSSGHSLDDINKGLVRITGLKQSRYQEFVCNKLKNSINSLIKSL